MTPYDLLLEVVKLAVSAVGMYESHAADSKAVLEKMRAAQSLLDQAIVGLSATLIQNDREADAILKGEKP